MQSQVWSLKEIDNTIFCGNDQGAFIINGSQAQRIASAHATWTFKRLKKHPEYILANSYQGFYILKKVDGKWVFSHYIKGFSESGGMYEEDENGDIRVRTFMEDTGFLEDPATGSANGDLAAYLLKYNFFGKDKLNYRVSQGSEMGRPSVLYVNAELNNEIYKIEVGGTSYTVSEGGWK